MIKIWGRSNSSNVQKVLWASSELGLAFERIDAGGQFGRVNEAAFVAMNPNRKIPVIEDDGFILWESNAIMRYLANRYAPGTSIYPAEPQPRADVDRWIDWHQTTIAPVHRPVFLGMVRTPPEKRDLAAIRDGTKAWGELFAILDSHLGGSRFVAGAAFTLADIPLGIAAHHWFALDLFERPSLPHLTAWYALLSERQGYRDYVKLKLT